MGYDCKGEQGTTQFMIHTELTSSRDMQKVLAGTFINQDGPTVDVISGDTEDSK